MSASALFIIYSKCLLSKVMKFCLSKEIIYCLSCSHRRVSSRLSEALFRLREPQRSIEKLMMALSPAFQPIVELTR